MTETDDALWDEAMDIAARFGIPEDPPEDEDE